MKVMKFVQLIFWVILICPYLLSAQNRFVKSGDKQFEKMAFTRALSYYLKAYEKDTSRQEVALKIAESFMKLNDPVKAESWYAKGIENPRKASAENKFHYAEALSSNGKYEEAKKWYLIYSKEVGDEDRVKHKIKGIENQQAFYKNANFVKIAEVSFNSPQADFSPAFYDTTLVFVSSRDLREDDFAWDDSHYLDLYQVNKNGNIIDKFDDKINSKFHEGPLVFFNRNNKIIFTRNNFLNNKFGKSSKGVNKLKMFYAEKQPDGNWGELIPLPFNSDEYSVGHPAISIDGSVLYFASDMPGGQGGTDLYKSEFKDGQWQKPVNLGSHINTEGEEMFPFLLNDQELYFASNGHEGLGGLDLQGVNLGKGPDAEIVNLGAPINTKLDDFGMIINQDGRSGYFSSNRENGTGNDDIYQFTATKSLLISPMVKGIVKDKQDGTAIARANVSLSDEKGKTVATVLTEKDGSFSFPVELQRNYTLVARQEKYFDEKTSFSTVSTQERTEWESSILLLKDYGFSLVGLISENHSKAPIKDVKIEVIDNMTGEKVMEGVTDGSGTFRYPITNKKLNDRISYQIKLSKEGYLGKSAVFNDKLAQPGEISLHKVLNINLDKIDVGTDIGKLIDVQPIYFDLGKSTIRPDAALELDKIVKIMRENPSIQIELGSHTDARGSAASNMSLSDKRAKASAKYVISKGVNENRIIGKGYGESLIINRCADGIKCSEPEHQENRRTEFKITKL